MNLSFPGRIGLLAALNSWAGPLEEILVYGRAAPLLGRADAASDGRVGYDDIRFPPLLRVGELVEAVPLNLRSHGHGQGYLDLNLLIPELVATAAYSKGPSRSWL